LGKKSPGQRHFDSGRWAFCLLLFFAFVFIFAFSFVLLFTSVFVIVKIVAVFQGMELL